MKSRKLLYNPADEIEKSANLIYLRYAQGMNATNKVRLNDCRHELVTLISEAQPKDGHTELAPGVFIYRASQISQPLQGVSEPSFCIIAQGSKEVVLGDTQYIYNPAKYLISTVALPVTAQIVKASKREPYLSLRLRLDPAVVSSVIVESGFEPIRREGDTQAINVSPADFELYDATVRLLRLKDFPKDARILLPLVVREIVYRLLQGEQGMRLKYLASLGGHAHQMVRAVEKLRNQFHEPLRVENLAKEFGMSPSGFHSHFKAVTAMSPLQFQKQLRLQEARRLMFSENLDATRAGFKVGYDNPAHFSREYKSYFGSPPMRDIERLRQEAVA